MRTSSRNNSCRAHEQTPVQTLASRFHFPQLQYRSHSPLVPMLRVTVGLGRRLHLRTHRSSPHVISNCSTRARGGFHEGGGGMPRTLLRCPQARCKGLEAARRVPVKDSNPSGRPRAKSRGHGGVITLSPRYIPPLYDVLAAVFLVAFDLEVWTVAALNVR